MSPRHSYNNLPGGRGIIGGNSVAVVGEGIWLGVAISVEGVRVGISAGIAAVVGGGTRVLVGGAGAVTTDGTRLGKVPGEKCWVRSGEEPRQASSRMLKPNSSIFFIVLPLPNLVKVTSP